MSVLWPGPSVRAAGDSFRIAFGSCSRNDLPQPLWPAILECRPDLWIWTGDSIYGDSPDSAVLRAKYAAQKKMEGYRRLASAARVIGTWDDHDYGENNAGREFSAKEQSQAAFLDFLDEPPDSPRRKQAGVYAGYDFGSGDRRVKVILLDCRYHRDAPGPEADILGEAQWKWLAEELHGSTARVNLIVSGIQVIPTEHRFEKWAQFPAARQRLFALLQSSEARGVIFLSGDRHQAEISRTTVAGTPLYDVTSSGLTHVSPGNENEPNRFRVAGPVAELNFGLLTLDWETDPATVQIEVRGVGQKVLLAEKVMLDSRP